jgi:hypothetical protein
MAMRLEIHHRAALALLTTACLVASCSLGPASKDDVCASFDALDKQLSHGNGIIGNPLFHKAGDLADVADRYNGTPTLASDAAEPHKIAKSKATSDMELANATRHIAQLCGHPLGTNALMGG